MFFFLQKIKINRKGIVLLLFIVTLIEGCLSTAKLSDFSKSANNLDFKKIAGSIKKEENKRWNSKTESEFYLTISTIDETLLIRAIRIALKKEGYAVKFADSVNSSIIGQRGLRGNEWNSIAGVYYQKSVTGFEIYIYCKITQDITGGLRDNRSGWIAKVLCDQLQTCLLAYPVNTKKNS